MAEVVITSFFTRNGSPAANIENVTAGYPIIRIWEILSLGSPATNAFLGEWEMSPVEDSSGSPDADDGFYRFNFETVNGFDPTLCYVFRVDGGTSIPPGERYHAQRFTPTDYLDNVACDPDAIVDGVWDETRSDHLSVGSTGLALSQIKEDTTNISNELYLNADSVKDIVDLILKFDTNRTKIDPTLGTLTIYDNDCVTALRTFKLLDSNGLPSATEVCERTPSATGTSDGKPTCVA